MRGTLPTSVAVGYAGGRVETVGVFRLSRFGRRRAIHRARTKTACRVISLLGPHVVLGTGNEYLWRISSPSTRGRWPCTANAQ
jgi:hypothetical protein